MRPIIVLFCGLLCVAEGSAESLRWDSSAYSQVVTSCDLEAAHGNDPHAVAPGVSQAEMDFDGAIEACEAAVAADPDNPRLQYQLARVYVYSGQGEKAEPHMEAATAAEYPQALFVNGRTEGNTGVSGHGCCFYEQLLPNNAHRNVAEGNRRDVAGNGRQLMTPGIESRGFLLLD